MSPTITVREQLTIVRPPFSICIFLYVQKPTGVDKKHLYLKEHYNAFSYCHYYCTDHDYVGHLQLYTSHKLYLYGMQCCRYFWLQYTVHVTLFPTLNILYLYMHSTQYDCFLSALDVVFSQCVAQVFWDASSCLYYYWYHICFYIPHELYFYCKVFIFYNLLSFLLYYISVSLNCNIYYLICLFFIIRDYDVRFVVGDGSVCLHFLIPQCGYLAFLTCL